MRIPNKDISSKKLFKNAFDRMLLTDSNVWYALAISKTKSLDLEDFLLRLNLPDLMDNLEEDNLISYRGHIDELLSHSRFNSFLNDINIDLNFRKDLIYSLPIHPFQEEVQTSKANVQAFFLSEVNPKLIGYLINWLREFSNINAPIISSILVNENISLLESLSQEIEKVYPSDKIQKSNIQRRLLDLIEKQSIIVLSLKSFDAAGQEVKELKHLFENIDSLSNLVEKNRA